MTGEYFIINCPHCKESIFIYRNETNCLIFRHAVYIFSGKLVNPQLLQSECEYLVRIGDAYGCCKLFRINAENVAEICE